MQQKGGTALPRARVTAPGQLIRVLRSESLHKHSKTKQLPATSVAFSELGPVGPLCKMQYEIALRIRAHVKYNT